MAQGARPHITGWTAISPFGTGQRAFADAVRTGLTARPTEPAEASGLLSFRLTDFDPAAVLGRKGIRSLDRVTLMVIATSALLLTEHTDTLGDSLGRTGLVLGTGAAGLSSIIDFTRDTFVRERPYLVNPAAFPNTVMNGLAGHTAIWHGLHGLNSTVSAGHLSGLAALRYASRMIRRGYAETLLVGCVDELSAPLAWATEQLRERHAHGASDTGPSVPMGEGCVMFLVDGDAARTRTGRRTIAEVTDFECRAASQDPADDPARRLSEAIRTVLRRNCIAPSEVSLVSLSRTGFARLDAAEREAVDEVFAGHDARRLAVAEQMGASFGASAGFQLCAALAMAVGEQNAEAEHTLLTSIDVDGGVGCALLAV